MLEGYIKNVAGSYYYEVRFGSHKVFRSLKYLSLSSLEESIPKLFNVYSERNNLSIHRAKDSFILFALSEKKVLGYSSFQPNQKSIEFLLGEIEKHFSLKVKNKDYNLNCIKDESLKTTHIKSVIQFLEEIEKIPLPNGKTFFFRGHSSYLYNMVPSIYRKKELIDNEDVIYKELLIRCPDDFEKTITTFEILVKMQHYSLPTRLLDLTANPLIALYFSCADYEKDKNDGEVKVLTIPKSEIKYFDSDTVSLLSNIAKQSSEFELDCIDDADNHNYVRYLDDIKKEKTYFSDRVNKKSLNSVVCVKPKLNNARIVKQDGAFLVFGIDGKKSSHAKISRRYMPRPSVMRLLIDNNSKKSIIRELERIGISYATIYPEIDKVSEYISKRFGTPEEVFENPQEKYIAVRSRAKRKS